MSNGPTPGDQLPIISIPLNSVVFYSCTVWTSVSKVVQLTDSVGNVLFTMQGSSPGPNYPATSIGSGSATAGDISGNYTLSINNGGGFNAPDVLWDQLSITMNNNTYLQSYTYIAEDSNDQDFNDCYLNLYWFSTTG